MVFSLWISLLNGKSYGDMMIGIKYGFYYLIIFLTASFVGFAGIKKINIKSLNWMQWFLIGIVFFGFIWQIMKITRPELFFNMWYGKFDDFYFGTNPPIYYLTWYEWTTRWQWLFSGPNNYGYFLAAFLPLVLLRWWKWKEKIKQFLKYPLANLDVLLLVLWILAIIMTLSRSAILASILIIGLLAKNVIKKYKKLSLSIFGIILLGVLWLSILKKESTMNHIGAKLGYISTIVNNPLGQWLGSSGPAVHHNGTMLPENYFMQLMLDIWTLGFIFWAILIFQILIIFKGIRNIDFKKHWDRENNELIYLYWNRLFVWWTALLVIGLFLHVFEDSMVNYLFFISFGLLSGYLSKLMEPQNLSLKKLFTK